jgi:glycosyl transferase family 1
MKVRKNFSVLLISPEYWQGHFVSKHHYALTLAKSGFSVFFLNPPVDELQKVEVRAVAESTNVFEVSSPPVARALRFYPRWLRNWLESRWLKHLEQQTGVNIDVVWLFENSRFFDMAFAGRRLKIYHQVDLNQNFQPEIAARTADICFCTTDYIREKLLPHNSEIYKIHHGVEIPSELNELQNEQLGQFQSATVNVAYVGNLEMAYLDTDILAELAREFSNVTFHFVGGFKKDGRLMNACKQMKNVIWWGKVDSRLILSILEHANVLLVTYHESRYKDQASPHKMMEYLASGKTIVTTYTDEYKDKRHLLEMVDRTQDFPEAFARVVENLDEYNSIEKQKTRIEYARQHSYDRQLGKIITLLKEHGLDQNMFVKSA